MENSPENPKKNRKRSSRIEPENASHAFEGPKASIGDKRTGRGRTNPPLSPKRRGLLSPLREIETIYPSSEFRGTIYYPEPMSDTLTISLDVEGVLANTQERMLKIYNEEHGTEYTFGDIDDWDWGREEIDFNEFMQIVRRGWNITPRQVRAFESHLGEVTHNLTHLGELDIVTARLGCKVGMREWFDERGITEYNQLRTVNPGTSKADLGYDIYIDDNPNLAAEISDEQMVCLIRRPYNTHKRASKDGVMKAETVHEASVKLLNRLAELPEI